MGAAGIAKNPMNNFLFDCKICECGCDGKSKGVYDFENDAALSEKYENMLIAEINQRSTIEAKKCSVRNYPDIELLNKGQVVAYLEVKFQQRTFMKVKERLPEADLVPSETLALNQSDLMRYFALYEKDPKPMFIVWGLKNRPCIVPQGKVKFYYQHIGELRRIYNEYRDKRRFRRASGNGDVIDGVHKGVVVNWHFSLAELSLFTIDEFLKANGNFQ